MTLEIPNLIFENKGQGCDIHNIFVVEAAPNLDQESIAALLPRGAGDIVHLTAIQESNPTSLYLVITGFSPQALHAAHEGKASYEDPGKIFPAC